MNNIEQIEQQMKELQKKLDDLKQEQSRKYPPMIPPVKDGSKAYYMSEGLDSDVYGPETIFGDDSYCNRFPTEEMAQVYADAFHFMLKIRMQEGAGCVNEDAYTYTTYFDGYELYADQILVKANMEHFSLIPPFPEGHLLWKAIENCGGKEHVLKIMCNLANIK